MELVTDGWSSGPVEPAFDTVSRWRGLMGREPRPILIRTRSVHGFWLAVPLWAVALDEHLVVMAVRMLRRRQVVVFPSAAYVLELPFGRPTPPLNARLTSRQVGGESARS